MKRKLTSDRIATLGSRMMKFRPDIPDGKRLFVIDGDDLIPTPFSVGNLRDAGASLVSQADGPEVKLKKGKAK